MNDEALAQASLKLYARLAREYTGSANAYNTWTASIDGINATLKAANMKPLAAPAPAPP